MGSWNIRDLLACFSPSFDFLAITSGDGRIKIWDTVKGQLQAEFSDIVSTDETSLFAKPEEKGHLSIDYTCMKWASLERKKKRKLGTSLLVLGTGGGDVVALDVSAGQLKWKISDCHPGGVSAIDFATTGSSIYTSGVDGMVCEIELLNGDLLKKFKAATKALSSVCVSSDGKKIATAAAQIKIYDSDHQKLQKFTGHPDAVRCMTMSDDGKYVFSSAVGERYIAVWRADGSKKKSSSCVLAMEQPPVSLDCRHMGNGKADGSGFYVLAISEVGLCYFWYGKDIEELGKAKPTKISVSLEENPLNMDKSASGAIFAARIQSIDKPASIHVCLARGIQIKPSFERIVLNHGEDLRLNSSRGGLLLSMSQPQKTKKSRELHSGATALDRSNAEGALLPAPKVLGHGNVKHDKSFEPDYTQTVTSDAQGSPMEDRLKSLGILDHMDNSAAESMKNSSLFLEKIDLGKIFIPRKMKRAISKSLDDAYKAVNILVDLWQSGSCSGKYVLPWIYSILVHRGHQFMSQESESATINSLYKIAKIRGSSAQCLLQLSGRLELVTAQIDKATQLKILPSVEENEMVDSEDESVEDVLFGEEDDDSETSGEDNDE